MSGRGPGKKRPEARGAKKTSPRASRPKKGGGAPRSAPSRGRSSPPKRVSPDAARAAETFGGGGDLRRVAAGAVARAGARTDLIYGRNPVMEALRAGRRRVKKVWATPAAAKEPWLKGVPVQVTDAGEIEERAGTDAHQGLCAAVEPYPYADAADLLRLDAPLLVALDEVQDPQNLGAIARTAECAGAAGLIVPERRSAEVTGAAAKASAGAVEHLPIAKVRNVADFLGDAKKAGLWCYGASERGRTGYDQVDWQGGVVVVLGAEGKGIRPRVQSACDVLMSVPLHGRIGSLNVSAAAAAVLYEAVRQRNA
jgi:23S rRNA (guanosine2251-2'-O)-methyltransferase